MTTRITLAILLTTWLVLIVGQTAAFLTARASLLALLDDTLITRANRLLDHGIAGEKPGEEPGIPVGDRYEIKTSAGQIVESVKGERQPTVRPTLTKLAFETLPDGVRVRTIELRIFISRDGKRVPYTITYSRPADRFDWLLSHLAGMMLLISLACGLTTAWLALKLSKAALKPLTETADVIAQIDEQRLSRRINADDMPVEMVPMAHRLNEMLARLQDVFQERKRFLADAAHELRTPTAALLTTLEVALRRPRDASELTAALKSGLVDARRLRKLVESLMEQARSENVRSAAESMQQTDITALVRECIEIVQPLAGEKQVRIEQDIPSECNFTTQRERLRSVLLNLLSNAIEYNKVGGEIRVRCAHDNGALRLSVADTGRGISKEQAPHVFEPFYRGGEGRGDDPDHLGLGLFLVRSHVEALRGKCMIDSELGVGTTMTIELPETSVAAAAADEEQAPRSASAPAATV
jgi:signal transduction histidine kinase